MYTRYYERHGINGFLTTPAIAADTPTKAAAKMQTQAKTEASDMASDAKKAMPDAAHSQHQYGFRRAVTSAKGICR